MKIDFLVKGDDHFLADCIEKLKINDDFYENFKPEDLRQENEGWLIYRKIGSQITYKLIDPSEYMYYDSTVKTLTFSKMLQLIHS